MINAPVSDFETQLDPLRYVVKVNQVAAVVGLIFFSFAVLLAWLLFKAHVPPALMAPWLWGSIAFLLSWLLIDIVLISRQPGDAELVRIWGHFATYVRVASNLVVLATIWMFLPHAPPSLQLVMMVFYVAHVPTQILAMPGRGEVNAIGTFAILSSVAIVIFRSGGEYAGFLTAFVTAYGIVMILLAFVLGRLIGNVLAERRKSDETALRLEAALIDVAEERDAKTRFIAAASHDLGQPLQAANLFFSQHVRAKDDNQRESAADGVRRAFASAEQLLSHMLNHLRLEADAVDPQFAIVSVSDAIRRTTALFTPASKATGIDIRAVASRHWLFTDKALLDRALSNLIDNALRHSSADRLLVGAHKAGPALLRLWVIDNGIGINSADAKRIFDDYYRGSESQAKTSSGFGLGLASVRRIADLLGGRAGLDARWRNGAAFYLELPAIMPQQRLSGRRRA